MGVPLCGTTVPAPVGTTREHWYETVREAVRVGGAMLENMLGMACFESAQHARMTRVAADSYGKVQRLR